MKKINSDLIEYNGINPCIVKSSQIFNQFNLEETFCIPEQKPNIQDITQIWVKPIIRDYELVKTPIGTSIEGQIMTGFKLLVCGELKLKVEYIACEELQTVHTAHTLIPFCSYAVMPKGINPNSRIVPSIEIEDILAEQINCRSIYINTTMMLFIDIC